MVISLGVPYGLGSCYGYQPASTMWARIMIWLWAWEYHLARIMLWLSAWEYHVGLDHAMVISLGVPCGLGSCYGYQPGSTTWARIMLWLSAWEYHIGCHGKENSILNIKAGFHFFKDFTFNIVITSIKNHWLSQSSTRRNHQSLFSLKVLYMSKQSWNNDIDIYAYKY